MPLEGSVSLLDRCIRHLQAIIERNLINRHGHTPLAFNLVLAFSFGLPPGRIRSLGRIQRAPAQIREKLRCRCDAR